MAVITLRVDDDLKKKMDELKEVNWSEVARQVIKEKISETELWEPVNVSVLREPSADTDALRSTVKGWNSTNEISKWRRQDQR